MRILFLLFFLPLVVVAQKKEITMEDLYKKGTFRGEFVPGFPEEDNSSLFVEKEVVDENGKTIKYDDYSVSEDKKRIIFFSGREMIFPCFEEKLLPAVDKFRPDLVLISAGFDSREGDPLGHFLLKDEDFADLTRLVAGIAERHARGRIVSLLEGGYNLSGLASAATAHVAAVLA